MSELFDMDARELIRLRRWFKKKPRVISKAIAGMLNEFAFGTRTATVDLLTARMTIRNPRFLFSRVRVTKASTTSQRSLVGTMAGARFSGFVEQEKGTPTERTRAASLAARAGSKTSQVKPRNRLKPTADLVTMEDYKVDRVGGFIAMLHRKKEKRLIRIKGVIYRRKGKGPLQVVQVIRPRNIQPKKRPFMGQARKNYFSGVSISQLWGKTLKRFMKF